MARSFTRPSRGRVSRPSLLHSGQTDRGRVSRPPLSEIAVYSAAEGASAERPGATMRA